jgi:hypothetical protein
MLWINTPQGACPRMHFHPTLRYFHKNNARNITYMAALIFPKTLI